MKTTQLNQLIQNQKKCHLNSKDWHKQDNLDQLSAAKRAGWRRILSSIATTEAAEDILMQELKIPFQNEPVHLDYLCGHQQDEQKHGRLIAQYLKQTLNYQKTKRTLSDKVLYDTIFPKLFKSFVKKPVYGLGILLFFEIYAVTLYKKIKNQAQADELLALSELIELIEQDEKRHIAGATILFYEQKERTPKTLLTKFYLRFLLSLAVLDLNMNAWAFHNRQIRTHLFNLGINPTELTTIARKTAKKIYRRFVKSSRDRAK